MYFSENLGVKGYFGFAFFFAKFTLLSSYNEQQVHSGIFNCCSCQKALNFYARCVFSSETSVVFGEFFFCFEHEYMSLKSMECASLLPWHVRYWLTRTYPFYRKPS